MELWSQNIFSPQNFENIDLLPSDFNVTNEKLGDSLHFSLEGFVIFFSIFGILKFQKDVLAV